MNGLELVRAVRAEPAWAGMRVMMVTAQTGGTELEEALAGGADEFLMKPFTGDSLLDKLALMGASCAPTPSPRTAP